MIQQLLGSILTQQLISPCLCLELGGSLHPSRDGVGEASAPDGMTYVGEFRVEDLLSESWPCVAPVLRDGVGVQVDAVWWQRAPGEGSHNPLRASNHRGELWWRGALGGQAWLLWWGGM